MRTSWKKLEQVWRKQLLSYAKGDILEIGVGEGDNFPYYPLSAHVTATDTSVKTIERAKNRAMATGVNANFIVAYPGDLKLPANSFDTIVSTFSLSVYDEPEQVLKKFSHWCRQDGQILLMEYGLSKYPVVNWIQRKWESYHYRRTGSHINRDILAIISTSGLYLKRVEVKYAGIVYLAWATLSPVKNNYEKQNDSSFTAKV
jgi:ubiquinone/menaquinone biosynthesis C-methylase UbiE